MDIIGHQKIREFLEKSLAKQKIAHAYLFAGPEHLGKMTVALEFVKSLQCQTQTAKPCYQCKSCQDIDQATHPDVSVIKPEIKENEKARQEPEIRIDQIRDLERRLSLFPAQSPYKIAIIEQTERLTREAANAFLKTLEEPTGKAVLILISSSNFLLPTIVSRCQIIKFLPVSSKEIENYCLKSKAAKEKAEEITRLSNGQPGLAVQILKNPEKLTARTEILNDLSRLIHSSQVQQYQYIEKLIKDISNLRSTLNSWLSWFRDLLLINQGCQNLMVNISQKENLLKAAQRYQLKQIEEIIKTIQRTIFLILKTKVNPKLALEVLILEL
ncbi:MAG TPA: DNA polymerase III subunit delta' [Candidatus Portnoybacteria bacterium]|nr:DNA polymerase III subunit delta' [Candidatus Portnoybacteria bacterium]